jgi:hypothetical protein
MRIAPIPNVKAKVTGKKRQQQRTFIFAAPFTGREKLNPREIFNADTNCEPCSAGKSPPPKS